MTKKAMSEKYTKMLEKTQDDIQFYKKEVMDIVEVYCTEKEIQENSLRRLVDFTIDRIEKMERKIFLSDWVMYQKAKREASIICDIICDLH